MVPPPATYPSLVSRYRYNSRSHLRGRAILRDAESLTELATPQDTGDFKITDLSSGR